MNFLRGRLFETMEKLQEDCLKWLDRTANGRPHSSTKRIRDEAFRDEQPFLIPFYGTPAHPAEGMVERLVRKDNTISFNSHYYSVPVGTHICDNTRVWVNVRDDCIDIYSEDTGKQIASHRISRIPGEAVLNEAHSLPKTPNRKELENYIMSYLEGSAIVNKWLSGLYESKPRYYRENISLINRELDSHLNDQNPDMDMETSLALAMYKERGFNPWPFGDVNTLANAKNTSADNLAKIGIAVSGKGEVRLISHKEIAPYSMGRNFNLWLFTQQAVKAFSDEGYAGIASMFADLTDEQITRIKALCYQLFSIADKKGWTEEALIYNSMITSWDMAIGAVPSIKEARRAVVQPDLFDSVE